MSPRITPDHLGRTAVVYVRQSTMSQVMGNLESQRRQYDLAGAAQNAGFAAVTVIDDDLGRSGSGSVQRPGFERLVAMVYSGDVGAVYCIEASRLARNGRDWHHLIDLCALAGAVVIDPDGAYDPRLVNDRYELSLLRQRGIAPATPKRGAGNTDSCCRLASAGARRARSQSTRTNMWSPRFGSSLPSSPSWAVRVRSFFSCGRPTPKCPSFSATLTSTS